MASAAPGARDAELLLTHSTRSPLVGPRPLEWAIIIWPPPKAPNCIRESTLHTSRRGPPPSSSSLALISALGDARMAAAGIPPIQLTELLNVGRVG